MTNGFYTSGEFAKKAHITKKTLRYYNDHGFLKPSNIEENGYKLYTDRDFEKLQRILLLKYLGFSLEDIKNTEPENENFIFSLKQQLGLLDERIKQMSLVRDILKDTMDEIRLTGKADWSRLLSEVSETGLKKSLMQQYVDTSNISVRIRLHSLYSKAEEKWFPWIYRNLKMGSDKNVLELGCGNGDFWIQNFEKLPQKVNITLSDNSEGVLEETRARFSMNDGRFTFKIINMEDIPEKDGAFDMVIANHVLFYAQNIPLALREIRRVLKPGGSFICSTYGPGHMREISDMMKRFDDRIVLAAKDLYEIFGKTNGEELLKTEFSQVEWRDYEDSLYVTGENDLIDYILSCHGNQNQYILENYREFKAFVHREVGSGLHVTKEAGIFVCVNGDGSF